MTVDGSSDGAPPAGPDEEAIVAALRAAARAVGHDTGGVVSMFDDAPSTMLFDFMTPHVTTLDQLRETTEQFSGARTATCEYPEILVRMLGADAAFSVAFLRVDAELADGTHIGYTARVTNVWRRFGSAGAWRSVHEHNSVPVDVTSGTADLHGPVETFHHFLASP